MRFDDREFNEWAEKDYEQEIAAEKEPSLKDHLASQEEPETFAEGEYEYIAIAPPLVLCMLPETPEYACPHCQTPQTFGVIVKLRDADVGVCFGYYRGCACCEWSGNITIDTEARRDWNFAP